MRSLKSAFRKWRKMEDEDREKFANQLVDAMVKQLAGRPPSEEELREIEERKRIEEEGLRIRRERLSEAGVDVAMFTEEKVEKDAASMLAKFIPQVVGLPVNTSSKHIGIDFKNMTKTGKVPKNVASAAFRMSWPIGARLDGTIVVNLTYTSDGGMNLVDMHVWAAQCGMSVSVRLIDGERQIVYVVLTEVDTGVKTTMYSRDAGDSNPDEAVTKAFASIKERIAANE